MRIAESVTFRCCPPHAARPVGVDAEVLLVDLDLDVVRQLGPDVDRGERGVAAGRLVERRDAHEPVDAGFGRHQAERVVAADGEGGALEARLVARLVVHDLAAEAAALGPAQVHPEEHLGPVLRLGAARARVDGDDGVLLIVLAAQELLRLGRVDVARRARRGPRRVPARRPRPARPTRRAPTGRPRASSARRPSRRPARAAGGAAAPSAPRPGPSRNPAGRLGPPAVSAPRAARRGQR